jgi:hypothetical protein
MGETGVQGPPEAGAAGTLRRNNMAMRATGFAFCEECGVVFSRTENDPLGTVRHPTADQWPGMNSQLNELYRKCPNAGKLFKHPLMEEVK